MNCIITLKIKDYYPKSNTIPYDSFVCLFTYGDFFGKIPLIQKSTNICKHEISTISSDIKYNIHILEYSDSSLIGICEMVIPFIKIKKINPPGTMIQEQKIKLIIDLNTKRKLFGKITNSGDIFLEFCAEVFIPDKNNIIINKESYINNVTNSNKKIQVRIPKKNKKNNFDGTPRTIKKKKIILEIKSNREMIQKDNSNDNIKANSIILDNNNFIDERNSTGIFQNKIKLENNKIRIIDFRNKNDNLYKNNEINLTIKESKKFKLSKKRSPKKKITILELMEQKMQPLLSNTNSSNVNNNALNNGIVNSRSNTNYYNGSNIKQYSDTKNNNKNKKIMNTIKNSNANSNIISSTNSNNINDHIKTTIKRANKKENTNSNKLLNSVINSPTSIILSPNHNISSPYTINTNKIKRNNSKGINRINKKNNNKLNLYNNNALNETGINKNNYNYNTLLIKSKRNSSQEAINRYQYMTNNCNYKKYKEFKEKDNNKKNSFKLGHYKRPKIDISEDIYQRKSLNGKIIKEYSYTNNYDLGDVNSNNGLLSTDERTEQGLSEIDKIILEKGTELRDKFQNQMNIDYNYNHSNSIDINKTKKNNIIKNNKISNNQNVNIEKLYYDMGDNQIIGGGNYTIETPKTNKDNDNEPINNLLNNKSSFCSSSQNITNGFSQEDMKNNYIGLIDLYYLLNQKLSKTIFENNDLYKKLKIYKEKYNNEIKIEEKVKDKNDKYIFTSLIKVNIKQSLSDKVIEKLTYIKSLESKLYQDIFGYNYDEYEIVRIKEIERVNKLNEERKIKILLKVLKSIINDCGNISQIFYDNKKKEKLLKDALNKYNIKEKKEGDENYINLRNINFNNINPNNDINYKFRKYKNILDEDDIFENKVIREVDEDKEEEESIYSASNNKANNYNPIFKNNNNIDINNIKDTESQIEEKKENNSDINSKNDEENKKIDIIKDILKNKLGEKEKSFIHLKNNEFMFDDKYTIFVDLNSNNEVIINIENKEYNIEEFLSVYCKEGNKNEKEKFIYKKKIGLIQNMQNIQNKTNDEIKTENESEIENNEHQKKRRKRRIYDDDSEEEKNEVKSMQ